MTHDELKMGLLYVAHTKAEGWDDGGFTMDGDIVIAVSPNPVGYGQLIIGNAADNDKAVVVLRTGYLLWGNISLFTYTEYNPNAN